MPLNARKPDSVSPAKPKTLIFGTAGVGKTWAALDFPTVYYIDTEGGANLSHYTEKLSRSGGVYLGPEDGANDLDFITREMRALYAEDHGFKTLVIDSITKPFNEAVQAEAARLGDRNAFGADKKAAIAKMRPLMALVEKLDMNVILIAHERPQWADGEQCGWTFDCWEKVGYDLHLIMRITKSGTSRYMTPVKSRLREFPEGAAAEWSFDEFRGRYEREFGPGILSREAEAVQLAQAGTLEEFRNLCQLTSKDNETLAKWKRKAKVERFEDMEEEKVQACIASMKAEINEAAQKAAA